MGWEIDTRVCEIVCVSQGSHDSMNNPIELEEAL